MANLERTLYTGHEYNQHQPPLLEHMLARERVATLEPQLRPDNLLHTGQVNLPELARDTVGLMFAEKALEHHRLPDWPSHESMSVQFRLGPCTHTVTVTPKELSPAETEKLDAVNGQISHLLAEIACERYKPPKRRSAKRQRRLYYGLRHSITEMVGFAYQFSPPPTIQTVSQLKQKDVVESVPTKQSMRGSKPPIPGKVVALYAAGGLALIGLLSGCQIVSTTQSATETAPSAPPAATPTDDPRQYARKDQCLDVAGGGSGPKAISLSEDGDMATHLFTGRTYMCVRNPDGSEGVLWYEPETGLFYSRDDLPEADSPPISPKKIATMSAKGRNPPTPEPTKTRPPQPAATKTPVPVYKDVTVFADSPRNIPLVGKFVANCPDGSQKLIEPFGKPNVLITEPDEKGNVTVTVQTYRRPGDKFTGEICLHVPKGVICQGLSFKEQNSLLNTVPTYVASVQITVLPGAKDAQAYHAFATWELEPEYCMDKNGNKTAKIVKLGIGSSTWRDLPGK
ncbi:hypothetical protein MUP32_00985 [Candidatus Microgenomates bacterium]|nr:hypothetical protein [Candidatus Microgenomates bacterium]